MAAVKQGCELYSAFKGTLVEAKDAIDDVAAIGTEVRGVWGKLVSWFAGEPRAAQTPAQAPRRVQKQLKEFDEIKVKKDITDQLIVFFKAYEDLKDHIAEQENRVYNASEDDSTPMMEHALYMVMAQQEMERLQVEIRETMIYGVSGMKDLYTQVITQVGVIAEQQELARIRKAKAEREAAWRRRRAKDKATDVALGAMGLLLLAAYLTLLMWTLVQDRQMRWGF